MKLDTDTITYIQNVVNTAQMIGIDNIIIEKDLVRAIDDDKTVVLSQSKNVPDMSFGSIGLNRIGVFTSRLDIARTQENFSIEARVDDNNEFARSLLMKGKGVRIDYRCANPNTISAPRVIKDEMIYRVQLTAEAVVMLQKGQTAMSAETVTINSTKDGVALEMVDINSDNMSFTFADSATPIGDKTSGLFAHRYPIKILLPLFKHDVGNTFEIGEKGIMSIKINGLTVYVLPQV